jgi:putrescine transport system substrate-binding protein
VVATRRIKGSEVSTELKCYTTLADRENGAMTTKKGVRRNRRWGAIAFALALVIAGCGRRQGAPMPAVGPAAATTTSSPPAGEEKVLNIYNWADLIDPSVVPAFENEYRIKVNYDVFDSLDVLETKLLAGSTGYDVVGPSAPYMQREIPAGVFRKLDKALLPNFKNLDASLNRSIEMNDPGNQYGVLYLWGTIGLAYNVEKIAAAMSNAPVDSLAMLYDPGVVKHFKDCGVLMVDAPDQVVETVLLYLGKDPNSESMEDLKAAEKVLRSIRPYVRYIDSARVIEVLATGEICLALDWNGDINQVRSRAKESGRTTKFGYKVPKEGTMSWFSMFAVPADAPHPKNAYLFLDYLMRPDVAARNSNTLHFATGTAAAYKLIDLAVYQDSSVYISEEQRVHLHPVPSHSPSYMRELTRTWTRFKTGQ